MTMTGLVSLLAGNTVVALVLALAAWAAGRAGRPALAHVAWLLVLVKLLTPPLWRVPVTSADAAAAQVVQPVTPVSEPSVIGTPVVPADVPPAPAGSAPAPADLRADDEGLASAAIEQSAVAVCWPCVLFAAWVAGGVLVSSVALVRVIRFRRLLRDGSVADDALQREIADLAARFDLAQAPQTCIVRAPISPMLWFTTLSRPRLVLPEQLLKTMNAAQRGGVIAHELAHLRRRDHWVRLLELPATVLLWFHPLVWIARRGLREAEEQCCDAWALSVLPAGRRAYADALVNAMELISGASRLPVGATGLGRIRTLRRRLTMIVTQSPPKSLSLGARFIALALLAMLAIAPVRGRAQPAQPPASDAAAAASSVTVAPGDSVQAAIDKAPDGATVTLAEGMYPETITLTKPITLVGAGWDKTTIGPERAVTSFTQQQKEDFFKRLEATTDPQQRARIAMEMAAVTVPPTLVVKDAQGITVRGLRIGGPYSGNPGSVNHNETLVRFDNAIGAVMSGCAVVGPSSNGVSIVSGSNVRIEKSLVAAVWGTGVQVYAGERGSGAKPAKVHLVDSDVRNCHHRCVTISGEGSVIERSRISGSAWHGIRYDHCSPTIKDNLIFGSARFGIYASGNTAARVTGNVFWRNEMEGMGCWFNNADEVEENTFVGNLRGGVTVLGDSTTKLTRNVIAQNPIGVHGGGISGRNNEVSGSPKPQLESNVFFGNGQHIQISGEARPLFEGNVVADPKFVAPEKGDFRLAPDSPVRKLGAGAADPIALASPFPIQPGEKAMIPDGETRDFAQWKHNPPAKAAADAPAGDAQLAGAQAGRAATTQPQSGTAASEKHRERQRTFAKARMRQDNRRFPKEDVAAAEELYQVANKNWRSEEARKSLETMIERYPELNRTGCAVLYLGQWSKGEERERLLKRAAEKHGDCFYGNGVQVGAFARYLLGHHYREQGKTTEAEKLFDDIRKNYPEAITHSGQLLVAILREEAKGTTRPNTATQPVEEGRSRDEG